MVNEQGKKLLPFVLAAFGSLLVLGLAPAARAQGGPPMITDDPGTPGNKKWEVNFLSTLERSRSGWVFETPNVDLNYGLGSHIQLKFEAPWVVTREAGGKIRSGLGNSMFGVKWRFLDEEAHGVDMSTYPQLEFNNPTKSVERGLVRDGMRLFLPIEVVKQIGPVEVNGEIGYGAVQNGPDDVEYGLAVGRQITKRVELIAELHGEGLRSMRGHELLFNFGSRIALSKKSVLLLSAGRTIRSAAGEGPEHIATVGIQFNF